MRTRATVADGSNSLITSTTTCCGFSLTGSYSDAEDLVQTTFVRALEHRHTFDGRSLMAWAVVQFFGTFTLIVEEVAGIGCASKTHGTMKLRRLPGSRLIPVKARNSDKFSEILSNLGGKCRELLLLYAYGYKTREIAVSLEMPQGTVGRRMMECRQSLHDALNVPVKTN